MQVGIAASKICQQMFFMRCIEELFGLREDILSQTGDGERIARRTSQHVVPRASERLGSDWKIDDEPLSRKREHAAGHRGGHGGEDG